MRTLNKAVGRKRDARYEGSAPERDIATSAPLMFSGRLVEVAPTADVL